MDNPNPAKVATVDEIVGKLQAAGTVVVTEYRGLDVPAQSRLRDLVRDAGGEFKIYKNTLTRLAAARTGLSLDEHLTGPTALAFSYPPEGSAADPVALTKALTDFQKENGALVIKGGVMDGASISADDVTALSKVAPREELLAEFAGLLQAPMSRFAALLQAMPTNFAGLVKALIDKGGASGAPADAADSDAAPADAPAEDVAEDADAGGVYETEEAVETAEDAEPGPAASAEETDAASEAATEDAAAPASDDADDAAASDQTDESADADSDETDDKED